VSEFVIIGGAIGFMERDDIFKAVQSAVEDTPLFIIGSGSSAPHGLPGMGALGNHLLTQLDSKYAGTACWDTFRDNLKSGADLEMALLGVTLTPEMLIDVKCETWKLISSKDLELFDRILFDNEMLPLARLIKKFYQAHPRKIDIITTNYDRVIEYACDLVGLPVSTGFEGYYQKRFTGVFPLKDTINILKVHGSLDVFRDAHDVAVSVPMLRELRPGLIPEIITPGRSKFEAILKGTPRQILSAADERIGRASGFLCIGYGFNDTQVQENIISRVRAGVPIVVMTQNVFDPAAHLLANNAKHYISIQEGMTPGTTEICIDRTVEILDGTFWTIDGFMDIID